MLTLLLDEFGREQYLNRPKFQIHRRREAVRSGKLIRPSLQRTISDNVKSWPGAKRPRRCNRETDIRALLEALVLASTKGDSSDEEDDKVTEAADPGKPSFSFSDSWQNKGLRELARERKSKSLDTAPTSDTM
jgi:hypothetical protein